MERTVGRKKIKKNYDCARYFFLCSVKRGTKAYTKKKETKNKALTAREEGYLLI